MDLIRLEDADGDRCIVRVTGRLKLGVLTGHDVLRAGVLAHASFVDARLEPGLFQRVLDAWQQELTAWSRHGREHRWGSRLESRSPYQGLPQRKPAIAGPERPHRLIGSRAPPHVKNDRPRDSRAGLRVSPLCRGSLPRRRLLYNRAAIELPPKGAVCCPEYVSV
ncbi:DUF5959 family protein [Streptomyces bauhiniae]|uniref:DUF5959 family protein n=1 Tax=Streptomyces bauhiniae TaxID=2340725 RepID=UPI00345325F2